MTNTISEKELQSYIISKVKENGFTLGEYEKLQNALSNVSLTDAYYDNGGDWNGFIEYVDNLIDKVLHGEQNPGDERNLIFDDIDDFESFDNRYNKEGFMKYHTNDELPDGFDNSGDPLTDTDDDDDEGDIDWSVFDDDEMADTARRFREQRERRRRSREAEERERAEELIHNRDIEQRRYEAESARNRAKRLTCKTPEELYNFKVKMGWIRGVGMKGEERERYIQAELAKCAREIEMRNKVEEAFRGPYWSRPFIALKNNK